MTPSGIDTPTRVVGATVAGTGTDADVLRAARALYAANPSHVPHPDTPPAGSVCAVNAIWELEVRGDQYDRALNLLRDAAGDPDSIVEWNAEHDTPTVLAAFDRAIAAAEAKS